MFLPERADIDAAFAWLKHEAAAAHPGVQLGLGAENFWDEVLLGRLQHGGLPTYDGGPAFLFEVNPRADAAAAGADAVRAAPGAGGCR